MKKYTFTTKSSNGGPSFMQPWGAWGCLWRTFLFLLALAILIILLSFFRSCGSGSNPGSDDGQGLLPPSQPIDVPVDDPIDIPDDQPIPGADDPVSDNNIENPGPNLPDPDNNYIPPISDDEIVPDPETGSPIVNDRLNVILDSDANDETFRRWAAEFKQAYPADDYKVLFYDPLTKLVQIQVASGSCEQVMRELPQKITDISFKVFREGILGPLAAAKPDDPFFAETRKSRYFDAIQAFDAWDITQGSPDVTIAVVDSYFDLRHPELYSDRIVKPFSVKRRTRDVAPEPGLDQNDPTYYHGSCVSSMATGNINNGNGAAGIAPKCKYMPISMGHQFTSMTMLYGMLYAMYNGANVVNISAGSCFPDEMENLPIEQQVELATQYGLEEADVWDYAFSLAEARGVTIVWAAGNNNVLASIDPSKRDNCTLRVSAVDTRLSKASFSNFGNLPDYHQECSTVSAPGVNILGAAPGNRYLLGPGTSYSAPLVAGAVALMKSLDPTLSTTEIITILQETGKPIDGHPEIGPLIQIKDALLRVKSNLAMADEIIQDHSKIIGKWQTTALLKVYDVATQQWNGQYGHIFLKFTSENGGTISYYIKENAQPCGNAPITVRWNSAGADVEHTTTAGSFIPAKFNLRKGDNGLLQAQHANTIFYLKRVDQMPCE